jgi:energy-coupling factor transporter ATP-binding protein EcfA2
MSCPDADPAGRALLAAGTACYDCTDFGALDKVPNSLQAVVASLTGLGFATVGGAPGYHLDPVLPDLRAAVRQAATSAPVVVVYYTGHGAHPEMDTYYLVGRASQPGDFTGTALAARELPGLLTRRDATGEVYGDQPLALVILDCCYSGRAGMEMLGEALHGIGNPRLWVIASAGALEYARQGEFAAALCDALERPTTGPSTQFLSLESIVQVINDARAGRGQEARVFLPAAGSPGIPPFFPNKHYRPGLAGLTVSEQHWLSRVQGAPQESTTGFYLTGRTGRIQAAEDLIGWMTAPGRGGLAVVTGSPGTGKSALLALPVLLSQPTRRADLLARAGDGSLIQRAATRLPTGTSLAAVHARGLNVEQAARVIADALGLVPGSATTLLKDLRDNPRRGTLVVVDALDEAVSPSDVVAELLIPLGAAAGLRVAVGVRRHRVPAAAQLTIDLDHPRYQDPEALADYLRRLLAATEEPGVLTPYQCVPDEVTAAVAAAIAQRATSSDGRAESFLIGRILALSVRGRPEPADVTSPGWQARLPAELTEAFDEDLGRLGDRTPVARTLLEALAWAQGPGLPWENIWVPVARALAGPGQPLITNDDVRWLLDKAGAYVVEDLGPEQRSVYRPFHDVLAAYLRGDPLDTEPNGPGKLAIDDIWVKHRLSTEEIITNALRATVPINAAGELQWDSAHPYLQTYLMQHATGAGSKAATALAQDEGFLAVTDEVTFSPYQGLHAFDEGSAPFFFGRETATAEVLKRISLCVDGTGLLVVSGVSGAGKSSLLRAGVLPQIRGAGLEAAPEAASWPCLLFTPGSAPLDELAVRVAHLAGINADAVRRGLDDDPARFALMARQAALAQLSGSPGEPGGQPPGSPRKQRLLLVVDQFEQVFTMCPAERQRQAFITALCAAAARDGPEQDPAALIVLGVRADFEARCADYPQLAGAIQDRYLLTSMTERQLRRTITEPAKAAGSRVDDDLVEVLLTEVGARRSWLSAGVLPLLSYALDQAWRSRAGYTLTLADYERAGGIEGAIGASAYHAYSRLTPGQQQAARHVFTRLTATSSDGVDTAARATLAELTEGKTPDQVADVDAVLEVFAAERLLTLAADTVEISHEALLSAWPLLRDTWLAESHADRRIRTQLRATAADWESRARDSAYLYRGTLLEAATGTAGRTDADPARNPPLSRAERDFLNASTRASHRSAFRRRMVVALLAAMLLILVTENLILLTR